MRHHRSHRGTDSDNRDPQRQDDHDQRTASQHTRRLLLSRRRAHAPAAHHSPPATEPKAPLEEIAAADTEAEHDILPAWQRAIDSLDLAALSAVSSRAVQNVNRSHLVLESLRGTPTEAAAEKAHQKSRALWSQLQTMRYRGVEVHGPQTPMEASLGDFVNQRYVVASRCIDAAARLADLCDRRYFSEESGWQLSPADGMAVAQLLAMHSDPLEQGFLWKTLLASGNARMVRHVSGLAGAAIRGAEQHLVDEAAATQTFRDELPPERLRLIEDLADQISAALDAKAEGPFGYMLALHQVRGAERGALVRILATRGLLHNLVRMGGDDVKWAIRAAPGYETWKYDPDRTTIEPEKTVLGAVKNAGRNLPGAALHFTAAVYDGLSDIPVIGPVAKRASKNLDDLRDYADEGMGVSEEDRKLRDQITGIAGHAESIILKTAVAAEAAAGEAAVAYDAARGVKAGYDAYSTAEKITGLVSELRSGWQFAKEGWGLFTGVMEQLSATATDALIDESTGDPAQMEHVIDNVSGMFDVGIQYLGGRLKKGDKDPKTEAAKKQAKRQRVAAKAASPELKIEIGLLAETHRQVSEAKDDDERARAQVEMQHHADRVRALSTPDQFANAALVEASEEDDEQKEPDLKTPVQKLQHTLGEQIKEAIVDFGVEALTSAKDQLVEALKAHFLEGKPLDLKMRTLLAKSVAKGASKVASDKLSEFVRHYLGKAIHAGIEHIVAEHFPEAQGLADLLDDPIKDFLKEIEKELDIDKYVEEPVEHFVLKLFGVPNDA